MQQLLVVDVKPNSNMQSFTRLLLHSPETKLALARKPSSKRSVDLKKWKLLRKAPGWADDYIKMVILIPAQVEVQCKIEPIPWHAHHLSVFGLISTSSSL